MEEKTSLKGSPTVGVESIQPLLDVNLGAPKGTSEKLESSTRDLAEQASETGEKSRFKTLTCIDTFTRSVNLLDRDPNHINDHINVAFEEVLAEPCADQSLDQTWRFAYVFFAWTKLWVYRVLAAACALPCGLLWGLIFSLLSVASVWIITPAMRIVEVLLHVVRRVWGGTVHAVLDPVFQSARLLIDGRKPSFQEGV